MIALEVLLGLAGSLVGLGALEYTTHKRNLESLPIRVHVSGTRGKSSVTRLLTAAMNHAGIATVGKTTGTLARMIMPNGREVPVYRPAGANIIEQRRIIGAARDLSAQAIVIECMALQPVLHWISENKLVRATHGVITNARPDHLDVMGPTDAEVAQCLAGMIPVKGKLFTCEEKHFGILDEAAKDRGSVAVGVTSNDTKAVSDEDMLGFRYSEHKENVALSLKILADLGVDRDTAIQGMWQANPDPGALSEHQVDYFGRRMIFINAFAANDPESTEKIWNYAIEKYPDVDRVIALFNLRGDRPSRTQQLANDADFWRKADRIVLMGSGGYLFARLAARLGVDAGCMALTEGEAEAIFESLLDVSLQRTLVIGMGNIGGQGLNLVRFIRNRAILGKERGSWNS